MKVEDFFQDGDGVLTPVEAETMMGDVRDAMLGHIRSMRVPWAMTAEDEQRDIIQSVTKAAENLVRKSVSVVAKRGMDSVVVVLGKWTVGDLIDMKVTAQATVETIGKLASHGQSAAVLILSDPSVYFGERKPAKPDKDQPTLPGAGADD